MIYKNDSVSLELVYYLSNVDLLDYVSNNKINDKSTIINLLKLFPYNDVHVSNMLLELLTDDDYIQILDDLHTEQQRRIAYKTSDDRLLSMLVRIDDSLVQSFVIMKGIPKYLKILSESKYLTIRFKASTKLMNIKKAP